MTDNESKPPCEAECTGHCSASDISEPSAEEHVIERFRNAQRRNKWVGRALAVGILGIATVNVVKIGFNSKHFLGQQSGAMLSALEPELKVVAERNLPRVRAMFQKVWPVYITAFEQVAARDVTSFEKRLESELEHVGAYAAGKWPELGLQIDKVSSDLEHTVIEQLEKVTGEPLSPGERDAIAQELRGSIFSLVEDHWKRTFAGYEQVARDIEGSIHKIISKEPDLDRFVDPKEATGIFLELMGRELQSEM